MTLKKGMHDAFPPPRFGEETPSSASAQERRGCRKKCTVQTIGSKRDQGNKFLYLRGDLQKTFTWETFYIYLSLFKQKYKHLPLKSNNVLARFTAMIELICLY